MDVPKSTCLEVQGLRSISFPRLRFSHHLRLFDLSDFGKPRWPDQRPVVVPRLGTQYRGPQPIININGLFDTRQANSEAIQLAHCTCPSITSLKLVFPDFHIRNYTNQFVATFVKALCVTNLEQLSLSINFRPDDLIIHRLREDDSNRLLRELSNALLNSNPIHRHLTSLSYNLTLPTMGRSNSNTPPKSTFAIPLDRIPNISSLTLTTFAQTLFTRGGPSITGHNCPCSLREVRFRDCAKGLLQGYSSSNSPIIERCRSLGHP